MKPKNPSMWVAGAALTLGIAILSSADAATLLLDATQKYEATVSPAVDLTTTGSQDWAYWTSNSTTVVAAPLAPNNSKTGATLISSLTNVGGTGLRGSTTADANGLYTWSDGTSPPSGTNVNLTGGLVFNDALNTNGAGFSFTVQGDPLQDYYVVLYAGGFSATGTISLTLNGATPVTASPIAFANAGPKQIAAYQILFRPDNIGDLLTVQFTASSVVSASSHIGIEAVTVGLLPVIPEPSVAFLGGLGVLLLAGKRRR